MGAVNCNGITIHYRTVGRGEDVVLIHGLGTNRAFWHLDVLLSLGRKFRVTIYDLRGHGYSTMPPSGYTSADMAADLHHLLDHLEIEKAHLVGHSLGGVIALHYAALYPERVASLIVADARVRSIQPTHYARDWPQWRTVKKYLEQIGLFIPEDESEAGIWLMETLASPEWQQNRDKLKGSSLFVPFSKWGGGNSTAEKFLAMLHGTTARQELNLPAGLTMDRLAGVRQQTLLMYGENSPSLLSLHGLQRCLPACRSMVVPGAGHFFPLSRARFFVAIAERFLDMVCSHERRMYERFPCRFLLGLREKGQEKFVTEVINVSAQGLLLKSAWELEPGRDIEIISDLSSAGDILTAGKIVRAENESEGGNLLGVELILHEDAGRQWKNFLAQQTGTHLTDLFLEGM